MLNVQELERKWIKYKIKSYGLVILLSTLFFILMSITIIFYPVLLHLNDKNITLAALDGNKTMDFNTTLKTAETNISDTNLSEDKLVLRPSLSFVDNMGSSVNTYYNDSPKSIPETKIEDVVEPEIKPVPEKKVVPVKEPPFPLLVSNSSSVNTPIKEVKAKKINIEIHSADDDLQDVIKRFKKTNNPTLGLFLAKRYYDMKQYNLAYNYALLTNQIDSKIDMSWIIFTKSLVKLGQKDKAVNTLQTYIKDSNSKQAATLLEEIESGRFK